WALAGLRDRVEGREGPPPGPPAAPRSWRALVDDPPRPRLHFDLTLVDLVQRVAGDAVDLEKPVLGHCRSQCLTGRGAASGAATRFKRPARPRPLPLPRARCRCRRRRRPPPRTRLAPASRACGGGSSSPRRRGPPPTPPRPRGSPGGWGPPKPPWRP